MKQAAGLKNIDKGLLVILGVFVLATVASLIYLGSTLSRLDHLLNDSQSSTRYVQNVQHLQIQLSEAESGVRGYLLTNNEAYLGPYTDALKNVPKSLETIKQSSGDEISVAQYKKLDLLTDEKITIMTNSIEAKRRGEIQDFAQITIPGRGKITMDEIRSVISTSIADNARVIGPRQEQSHESVQRAISVAVAVSVFVIGICAVISWYFQRSILRERALESTKSEFLSLASHQLRTPATNVKQYIGLLMDGYLGNITKKQRGALEIAYKNNESEIRIMNDLLDVAKLDLKRIQLHKQRTNIVSVVRQVVKDFRQNAEKKGQTLELRAPHEVVASVDREYLKGVIEKLVDNAIKYSKDKTNISVRVKINDTLGVFEIIVKDQGLGIQKREVPKLFMKFSRIANEFSANSEGSGLGLYWVKQVMALHGGTVEVKTQEGRGSKFIVRAPLT